MENWQGDLVQALLDRLQALALISEAARRQAQTQVHAAADFPEFIHVPDAGGKEEA